MISVDIEKEIKKENKIIGNFNLRQVISISVGVVLAGLLYLITDLTIEILIIPFFIIGSIVAYVGWPHKNNLTAEQVIEKKVSRLLYKNETRKYRTLNSYVVMLNKAYTTQKQKDLADKKIAKKIKKQEKMKKKKISKIKSIA